MGTTETDSKGSGPLPSQSVYLELRETPEHIGKDGMVQGVSLPVQSDNRQPSTVTMAVETNGKDLPSCINGGLAMMSGLYCTEGTINAFTTTSGFSTTVVSHANDIRPPTFNSSTTSHKQKSWIPQKPQIYQVRNFEPSKEMTTSLTTSMTANAPLRVARPPPGGGKSQLLPRYWPRMTDQELQLLTMKEYSFGHVFSMLSSL